MVLLILRRFLFHKDFILLFIPLNFKFFMYFILIMIILWSWRRQSAPRQRRDREIRECKKEHIEES